MYVYNSRAFTIKLHFNFCKPQLPCSRNRRTYPPSAQSQAILIYSTLSYIRRRSNQEGNILHLYMPEPEALIQEPGAVGTEPQAHTKYNPQDGPHEMRSSTLELRATGPVAQPQARQAGRAQSKHAKHVTQSKTFRHNIPPTAHPITNAIYGATDVLDPGLG
jgi:hypothetical protein